MPLDGHPFVLHKAYLASFEWGLDDLAAFRRALTPAEVRTLHALPGGVADLR